MTNTAKSLLRQPLIWLAIVALALLTMVAFEKTGGSGHPAPLSVTHVSDQSTPASATHVRHCTDGQGTDVTKNKHCRGASDD